MIDKKKNASEEANLTPTEDYIPWDKVFQDSKRYGQKGVPVTVTIKGVTFEGVSKQDREDYIAAANAQARHDRNIVKKGESYGYKGQELHHS